jgi:predicted unusual protein kinase regulating ubiquinone biosynthesis (AarF/ABC1/UbiB family)
MYSRLRFLKAYRSALTILGSYLFLAVQKRILGEVWGKEKSLAVHRRNARRIERTILELKGLFIKVGQMLSIMSNFLPEALTRGLEGLQDSVPPHPYQAIETRFLEEFRRRPRELFADFEEAPIASASLGQVHVGRLPDGTKVAVKVQYPEIDDIVRSDLKTLKRIFGLLHFFFPAYGLRNVYQEIADVVIKELDYTYEGKNLETLKKNFEKENDFLFPDVFWEFSTSKILTLRFMEGIKVSAVEEFQKQGIDPSEVARKIIHAYCKQIFIDGVYHADPHPGNLLVQKDGTVKIILVDFGATARISERMKHGITLFAEGLIKRDTRMLANAMREMGFVARQDSFEPFEQLVDYFYEKLSNIKIENFRKMDFSQFRNLEDLLELRKIKISFRDLMTSFHVPKDWILLERAMLLAMGLCAHLDPRLNPIEIVLPYVERFVLKDRTFAEVVIELIKEIGISYLQLPHEVQKTLRRLNEGALAIRSRDLPAHTRKLYILGHQVLYGFLSVSGLFLAVHWKQNGFEDYGKYAFYGAIAFGILLAGSILRNRAS